MPFRPSFPVLKTAGKTSSWLVRQFADPYVQRRAAESYRSRSAFKLLEMEEEHHFLTDVDVVVDLGAAPGGWSQAVAWQLGWSLEPPKESSPGPEGEATQLPKPRWQSVEERAAQPPEIYDPLNIDDFEADESARTTKGRGIIIAADLLRIASIPGVYTLEANFLNPATRATIQNIIQKKGGKADGKADVILSDMAANFSGNRAHDIESSLELCSTVYDFARENLRSAQSTGRTMGGTLLLKHFSHPAMDEFRSKYLNPHFARVLYIKPDASRSESSEGYWLCRGFRPDGQKFEGSVNPTQRKEKKSPAAIEALPERSNKKKNKRRYP